MVDPREPVFPVRVVLRRTGLTAELLRAWERRYGVVTPARTKGGQRIYSEADVARLALLRRATMHGHSIGRIAALEDAEVEKLVETETSAATAGGDANQIEMATATRRAAIEAVQWMDGGTLDTVLRRAAMALGPVAFGELVVAPLAREVGDLWHVGRLRIVQEHLATATIRQVLGHVLGFTNPGADAPVFVSATISGQHHEIGAMLAAIAAASLGWRSVYLGPDLPGNEIGLAASRLRAGALGISFVYPADPAAVGPHLAQIAEAVGRTIPVYVGGEAAAAHRALLEQYGFQLIGSLTDLTDRLAGRVERVGA